MKRIFLLALCFFRSRGSLVEVIVGAAVPFVFVSIVRRLIRAPRPYELYDFYENLPKDKSGSSFPSRHAFSAFVIGTLAMPHSIILGVCVLALGVILSVARVLLGIHFIRDILAGALVGAISGILALLIF